MTKGLIHSFTFINLHLRHSACTPASRFLLLRCVCGHFFGQNVKFVTRRSSRETTRSLATTRKSQQSKNDKQAHPIELNGCKGLLQAPLQQFCEAIKLWPLLALQQSDERLSSLCCWKVVSLTCSLSLDCRAKCCMLFRDHMQLARMKVHLPANLSISWHTFAPQVLQALAQPQSHLFHAFLHWRALLFVAQSPQGHHQQILTLEQH